jgi:hypothetical protein
MQNFFVATIFAVVLVTIGLGYTSLDFHGTELA